MTNTVTIPLDAAIAIAMANGWDYDGATIQNADGAIYEAHPDFLVKVLAMMFGNAVNTVPYTTVAVEVTA